jgi:hypothetical protein
MAEVAAVGALMALAVLAHHPGRMLSRPLWLDENWVADSLRAPLGRVASVTSSTPIGFSLLLRLVPHRSPAQLRALPLAFAAASVVPAWLLGRVVQPRGWATRVLLGAAVAVMPAMLLRQDLKQYTGEAFTVLVLVWLVARAEQDGAFRRLATFAAATALGLLLSDAAVFVGAAGFLAMFVVALLRRRWGRLRDVVAAGAGALVVVGTLFLALVRPGDTPALRAYWRRDYVPVGRGLHAALAFLGSRAGSQLSLMGMGPRIVPAALMLVGLVVLVRRGLAAVALALVLVVVELVSAAAAQQYPLWNTRTSTWFTALATATAVIGLAGAVQTPWWLVVRRLPARRRPAGAARWWGPAALAVAVAVGLAAVGAWAVPLQRSARLASASTTPPEDVAGEVATILAERHPGDVVLANASAGYGVGVSWPAAPEFLPSRGAAVTFRIGYPLDDRVVVAAARTPSAELAAVRQAVALARVGPGARIWLVLSHAEAGEQRTFLRALAAVGTVAVPPGQRGSEPVRLVRLG